MTRKAALLQISVTISALGLGAIGFWRWGRIDSQTNKVSYFSRLIEDIAECIIPRTDSPGARDADVSKYIISVVENCFTKKEKRNFIRGLSSFDRYCRWRNQSPFSECDEDTQRIILYHFEKKAASSSPLLYRFKSKLFGKPFFSEIKWLTVTGYASSFLGATKGFAYDPMPINFIPCIPYRPGQRSWATS